MSYLNREDTIVAIATAPGAGAIAVIRLSGTDAIFIAESIFKGRKKNSSLKTAEGYTMHFGVIEDNGQAVDEVLLSLMRSPASYTGENVVEISCHGSVFIQQKILQLCRSKGARLANPGEFTMRAFLNGKMDLSQAEAVADLIASDSSTAHELAIKQMRGGFSGEIALLRKELIHFASLIELELDFAEEDVEFASREKLKSLIGKIQETITRLIESFELGNVIRKGIPVVIAGKPNAGKSTLMNALLNEERAIVSPTAGTTRDTIEEEINLGGIKFRFIDTAGLRQTEDEIEKEGVTKAFEKINSSPVLLYIFDVNETDDEQLKTQVENIKSKSDPDLRIIAIGNKIDQKKSDYIKKYSTDEKIIFISAKEKINIEELTTSLLSLYDAGKVKSNNSIVSSVRHAEALKQTSDALSSVTAGIDSGVTNDFIVGDIRSALYHLGEITGEISTEDLLENIFSKFCIGK